MATSQFTQPRYRIQKIKTVAERLWPRVHVQPNYCWRWVGYIGAQGYGRISGPRRSPVLLVHRVTYELLRGAIPDGTELDHLCRNRWCCNPDHLEAVPHRINAIRGHAPTVLIHITGRCARGHEVTAANVYYRKDRPGKWNCNTCRRERRAEGRSV